MKRSLILFLSFITGIFLPLKLQGQNQNQPANTLSSIVGKTFYRMEIGDTGQALGIETLDAPVSRIEVILVAAGDTLRTKTDDQGRFSFSGIAAKNVTLSMVNDNYAPFSESFVLMPGENVVIVPRQRKIETLDAASVTAEAPVMTMKGDTLVYHANALTVNEGDYAIDLLRSGSVYTIAMGSFSVTHICTPVYGRYFVLDISYSFNNSGGRSMPRYGI